MWTFIKTIGTLFVVIFIMILLIAFWFAMSGVDLFSYSFFAPKYENVRRNVFENTQSYIEGKRQELSKYRLEYIREKDSIVKEAIASTIRQSFTNFNKTKLDYDSQIFLDSLNK